MDKSKFVKKESKIIDKMPFDPIKSCENKKSLKIRIGKRKSEWTTVRTQKEDALSVDKLWKETNPSGLAEWTRRVAKGTTSKRAKIPMVLRGWTESRCAVTSKR